MLIMVDMLMFIAFPLFVGVAALAMVAGGGMELWSASAMKAGLKEGIKQAREENAAREAQDLAEQMA